MSLENYPPAFFRLGLSIIEVQVRVLSQSNYEIFVKGDGSNVSADSLLNIINNYINHRFVQVDSVEVYLYNVRTDSIYIQDKLNQEHDINAVVCVEDRYTNGYHM